MSKLKRVFEGASPVSKKTKVRFNLNPTKISAVHDQVNFSNLARGDGRRDVIGCDRRDEQHQGGFSLSQEGLQPGHRDGERRELQPPFWN